MNRKLPYLFFIIFLLSGSFKTYATHIFGGELLYSWISGNNYRVTLTVYGDCGAYPSTFNSLYSASPAVYIFNGNSLMDSMLLKPDVKGLEVSPVCPGQLANTSCNGGTQPGVRKFTYTNTITLSGLSPNWRFIFSGEMGLVGAGRSSTITNIEGPGTSIIQLEADLNNMAGPNSSPRYSTIPTPFYCLNVEEQYNHGAIDADGDSLVFNLIPGISANGFGSPLLSQPVTYSGGYTARYPLATKPGSYLFNTINGQITFIADKVQKSLVVCQVAEYRGGVLVGTSEREMTFVVMDNCQGTPPNLSIANLTSGVITGKNVVNICTGTPHTSFDLALSNPDGDSTSVTCQNLMSTATLNITDNNTPSPSIHFDWITGSIPVGVYTFYVTVKNNHCPISNTQTIAYTVNIAAIPTLKVTLQAPTQCIHRAKISIDLSYGFIPRHVNITSTTGFVKNYVDTTGNITDSFPPGTYNVIANSDPLCTVSAGFSIIDSGTLPLPPLDKSLCVGDPEQPMYLAPAGPTAEITWYNSESKLLPYPPTPYTSVPAVFTWYVMETYKVCTSLREKVQVVVHGPPLGQIINIPANICFGDTVVLSAVGGVTYIWSPPDKIITDSTGLVYTRVVAPVTLSVGIIDEFGCKDSSFVSFNDVQPCCNFMYPTAFTPNGDGKNDGFRVSSYGNMWHYRLTIYNRWGQVVFDSLDPHQYWDGKQYGVPC